MDKTHPAMVKKKKRRKFHYYLDCIEYNFDSLLRKEN